MTRLAARRTRLTFETDATARYRGQERTIIVEPDQQGHCVSLRLKGCRARYEVSWRGVFDFAAKVAAESGPTPRPTRWSPPRLTSSTSATT